MACINEDEERGSLITSEKEHKTYDTAF